MNRHEGVSCNICLTNNFKGRRYKCLRCYDFDLCSTCYEAGAANSRHTSDHPMQCILTRVDFEMHYAGEFLFGEEPQSFTCPFCGRTGFTSVLLQEHCSSEHPDASDEVICPICAATPDSDPNLETDDFGGHLAMEHQPGVVVDEPVVTRQGLRRTTYMPYYGTGRGPSSARRRSNVQFRFADYLNGPFGGSLTESTVSGDRLSSVFSSASSLSPLSRDTTYSANTLSELLSHLSDIPRSANQSSSRVRRPSQSQTQVRDASSSSALTVSSTNASSVPRTDSPQSSTSGLLAREQATGFLLPGLLEERASESRNERRMQFVRELVFSTLGSLASDAEEPRESAVGEIEGGMGRVLLADDGQAVVSQGNSEVVGVDVVEDSEAQTETN